MKKNEIEEYILISITGAVLLYFDFRFFLFFIPLMLLRTYFLLNTYIHAILVNQNYNRLKIRALMRKMKITNKEIENIIEEAKSELSASDIDHFIKSIYKDVKKN